MPTINKNNQTATSTALFAVGFAGILFSPQLTFFSFGILYVLFLRYMVFNSNQIIRMNLKIALVLSCALIFLIKINGFFLGFNDLFEDRNVYIAILLFILIFDFSYVYTRIINFEFIKIYKISIVIIAISFIYIFFRNSIYHNVSLTNSLELIFDSNRNKLGKLIELNPNHQDDVYFYTITFFVWISTICRYLGLSFFKITIPFSFVFLIFGDLFINTGSRGAWLGAIASICLVFIVLLWHRSYRVAFILLLGVVTVVGINTNVIFERASSSLISIYDFSNRLTARLNIKSSSEEFYPPNLLLESKISQNMLHEPIAHALVFSSFEVFQVSSIMAENGNIDPDPCNSTGGVIGEAQYSNPAISLRLEVFKAGYLLWLQKPILGYGGYDRNLLSKNLPLKQKCAFLFLDHVHNQFLDLLIRGGVVLLGMFLMVHLYLLISLLKICFDRSNYLWPTALPLSGFVVYCLIENLFDLNFSRNDELLAVIVCFWFMASITLTLSTSNHPKLGARLIDLPPLNRTI